MRNDIPELTQKATQNISDILTQCIHFDTDGENKALVVYDSQNGLTGILTQAYRNVLPNAKFVDFDTMIKEEILAEFALMSANDLVVQIQSMNFRLDDFRIRLHLFGQKLRVIEHMHLQRNKSEVWDVYIDSLAYDSSWYRVVGPNLSKKLENTSTLEIFSKDAVLTVVEGLEIPKPNLGDYTGMDNIGGTFPIGEVFTEAKAFANMNGSVYIYAFADKEFNIDMHEPFRIDIEKGIVVGYAEDAPKMFTEVYEAVTALERPLIREIGFGLNRSMTKEKYLGDITAFERILGLHLSMGEKHSVYKKEGIIAKKSRFHVDLFLAADKVTSDGKVFFENGKYIV
jgi:aminopeptidase